MVESLDIVRFIFRFLKICSNSIITGLVVSNYMFGPVLEQAVEGTELEETFKIIYGGSASLAIFSGLASVHLVKRNKDNQWWRAFILIKFFLSLLLTPLFVNSTFIHHLGKTSRQFILGSRPL